MRKARTNKKELRIELKTLSNWTAHKSYLSNERARVIHVTRPVILCTECRCYEQ